METPLPPGSWCPPSMEGVFKHREPIPSPTRVHFAEGRGRAGESIGTRFGRVQGGALGTAGAWSAFLRCRGDAGVVQRPLGGPGSPERSGAARPSPGKGPDEPAARRAGRGGPGRAGRDAERSGGRGPRLRAFRPGRGQPTTRETHRRPQTRTRGRRRGRCFERPLKRSQPAAKRQTF